MVFYIHWKLLIEERLGEEGIVIYVVNRVVLYAHCTSHIFLLIFDRRVEWIEENQLIKFNKNAWKVKKECVHNSTLIILHAFLLDPTNPSLNTQEYRVLLSKTLY